MSEQGRITHGCVGLWNDEQAEPLRRIADLLHRFDYAAGVQLSHSGQKGLSERPWEGAVPLSASTSAVLRSEPAWTTISVSAVPFDKGWPTPVELTP